jgi:hypothetical protein
MVERVQMSKFSRALTDLATMRSLAATVTDAALRSKLLAKIGEVEMLVKSAKRNTT